MFWKCFGYFVDFKNLFLVFCKLTLSVCIFFWMEVLCILKISLVVTHAFVQEIINKISSGFVFILFCCSCARLIWAMFVFILSQETKVTCYPKEIQPKNLVEDLILEMTVSSIFKWKKKLSIYLYNFQDLLLGLELCFWNIEKCQL